MNELEKTFLKAKELFLSSHYDQAKNLIDDIHPKILKQAKTESFRFNKNPRYSLIVVAYKESNDFYSLLKFLVKYEEKPDFEIIIVSNFKESITASVQKYLKTFTLVNVGFNYGCSGGRNLGAHFSNGKYIVFIDDDGALSPNAIEALTSCIENTNAVTCRGKVKTKTPGSISGGNYDKGEKTTISIPDAEGISIWNKKVFLEFGGFDPLLSGHEGLQLCLKVYPFHGPQSFQYTPDAILFHDYADSPQHNKQKQHLHSNNRKYLEHLKLKHSQLTRSFKEARFKTLFFENNLQAKNQLCQHTDGELPKLTIITTVRNGQSFIADYVRSLQQQTYQNFHIVFIDDGSTDKTAEQLLTLWENKKKLTLVKSQKPGRAAALNLAIDHAESDICVIADIDDISLPSRLHDTAAYFHNNSSSNCVSFYCFNEESIIRGPKPFYPFPISIKDKAFTGMPVSFPSFAFRRSLFKVRFDESLFAGIDCDWIYRSIFEGIPNGHLIPTPMVYYRIHDNQITAKKRDAQRDIALKSIFKHHSIILGDTITSSYTDEIELLSGWSPILNTDQENKVLLYVSLLLSLMEKQNQLLDSSTKESLLFALYLVFYESKKGLYKKKLTLEKPLNKNQAEKSLPLHLVVKPTYGIFGWRRIFIFIILPFVKLLAPPSDVKAYKKDPIRYLASLEKPFYIKVRKIFFPQ